MAKAPAKERPQSPHPRAGAAALSTLQRWLGTSPGDLGEPVRLGLALGLFFGALILATPLLPAIDLPQHIALGAQLQRYWQGDEVARSLFQFNWATHNGGIHLFIGVFGRLLGAHVAGRAFVALYPVLLLSGLGYLLKQAKLGAWRLALALPALFGFAFGWGFANFLVGSGMALWGAGLVARQLNEFRLSRIALLAGLSVGLGFTHVLANLLLAICAALLGLEWWGRGERTLTRLARVCGAGGPLLMGCLWDLHVLQAHLERNHGSYTTPDALRASPGWLPKLAYLANALSGLYGTFADVVLAWLSVALLVGLFVAWLRGRAKERQPPHGGWVSPFVFLFGAYFAVPAVFLNTHLIYQRLAQWALLWGLLAIPRAREGQLWAGLRRLSICVGALALISAPLHFAAFSWETRDLRAMLRQTPQGQKSVGAIAAGRTASIRLRVLTHSAALAVTHGSLGDGYSFGRFMGPPLNLKAGAAPPCPNPSWEHNGSAYGWRSQLAATYPRVLVKPQWCQESNQAILRRLFRPSSKVIARRGCYLWVQR